VFQNWFLFPPYVIPIHLSSEAMTMMMVLMYFFSRFLKYLSSTESRVGFYVNQDILLFVANKKSNAEIYLSFNSTQFLYDEESISTIQK